MTERLEGVAEQQSDPLDRVHGEACLAEDPGEPLRVVAPVMAGASICGTEAVLSRGHAQKQPAARPEPPAPHGQRRTLVADVFQHLEGADEVEPSLGIEVVDVVDDLPSADLRQSRPRRGSRRSIGLDADVVVGGGQPGAERALARSDLQNRSDVVESPQERPDGVVPKPRSECQRRRAANVEAAFHGRVLGEEEKRHAEGPTRRHGDHAGHRRPGDQEPDPAEKAAGGHRRRHDRQHGIPESSSQPRNG